jgi:hypothetical protein
MNRTNIGAETIGLVACAVIIQFNLVLYFARTKRVKHAWTSRTLEFQVGWFWEHHVSAFIFAIQAKKGACMATLVNGLPIFPVKSVFLNSKMNLIFQMVRPFAQTRPTLMPVDVTEVCL